MFWMTEPVPLVVAVVWMPATVSLKVARLNVAPVAVVMPELNVMTEVSAIRLLAPEVRVARPRSPMVMSPAMALLVPDARDNVDPLPILVTPA